MIGFACDGPGTTMGQQRRVVVVDVRLVIGKTRIDTAPMSMVIKAITFANTGLSIKNLDSMTY